MTKINEDHRRELSRAIASWYVRKDNKYYRVDAPGVAISQPDVKQASFARIRREFPHIELDIDLLRAAFKVAFGLYPEDTSEAISPWSGRLVSRPGDSRRIMLEDGFATINLWRPPVYRDRRGNAADWGATGELLEWLIPDESTRRHVTDWIAWNLQNEADRPTWSLFLHSKAKGTGKSLLCQVLEALFGAANTTSQNGITKLTGRFNTTVLLSKLVVCEEVKLKQGSSAANDLKTFISEPRVLVEQKGQEAYQTDQHCCFVFTSNHLPLWLEADDRRYFIVDVEHEGHASGPRTEAFQQVVRRVQEQINDPVALGALYNALIHHEVAEGFNAKSLNTTTHATPVMRFIQDSSRQVSTERLEEYLNGRDQNFITQSDLVHYVQSTMHANTETIRHKMLELGWHKVSVKWGGVDYAR
ncbi:hypothetical protein SAMN04487859_1461, partial [Roseovarius lutimaris]